MPIACIKNMEEANPMPDIQINMVPMQFKELFRRLLECIRRDYRNGSPVSYELYYKRCRNSEHEMQNLVLASSKHLDDINYIFSQAMRTKRMHGPTNASALNSKGWIETELRSFFEELRRVEDVTEYMSGRKAPFEAVSHTGTPTDQTFFRVGLMAQTHGMLTIMLQGIAHNDMQFN